MNHLDLKQIAEYVEANVGTFHRKRLESLENLKLKEILQRKNPYLFKAKNILTAQDLVKSILNRTEKYKRAYSEIIFHLKQI
jgi:hypothetical protein